MQSIVLKALNWPKTPSLTWLGLHKKQGLRINFFSAPSDLYVLGLISARLYQHERISSSRFVCRLYRLRSALSKRLSSHRPTQIASP